MTGSDLTWAQSLAAGAQTLRSAGIEQAGLDARLLLAAALDVSQTDLILRGRDPLSTEDARKYENLVDRRLEREPVSRIIGVREFFGQTFAIGPAVLDPRPDTETLVESALALPDTTQGQEDKPWPCQILDLGTGSGAILLSLLPRWSGTTGVGVDISPAALDVAARNAATLGLGDRATFVCSDWDAALTTRFDLIVSNPPYISTPDLDELDPEVARFDPGLALDGGRDGLDAYRALSHVAGRRLNPGGCLMVEIGHDQAGKVRKIFGHAGLTCEATVRDLAGRDRVIAAWNQKDTPDDEDEKALGKLDRSS